MEATKKEIQKNTQEILDQYFEMRKENNGSAIYLIANGDTCYMSTNSVSQLVCLIYSIIKQTIEGYPNLEYKDIMNYLNILDEDSKEWKQE